MQCVIKSLLLVILLVSCSTDDDPRYQDISYLERPPTLPTNPNYNGEVYTADTSRIEKKSTIKGLGDEVYLTSTNPVLLKIKQPLNKAWIMVGRALRQTSDLKLTDHERDKKHYYAAYKPSGLFDFMSSGQGVYQIKLKADGQETSVSAELSAEPKFSPLDEDNSHDNESEKVLKLLYETLHDEVQAE